MAHPFSNQKRRAHLRRQKKGCAWSGSKVISLEEESKNCKVATLPLNVIGSKDPTELLCEQHPSTIKARFYRLTHSAGFGPAFAVCRRNDQ
jgi:hypothetical protein